MKKKFDKHPFRYILIGVFGLYLLGKMSGGSALGDDGTLHVVDSQPNGPYVLAFGGKQYKVQCEEHTTMKVINMGIPQNSGGMGCNAAAADGLEVIGKDTSETDDDEISEKLELQKRIEKQKPAAAFDAKKREIVVFTSKGKGLDLVMYVDTYKIYDEK